MAESANINEGNLFNSPDAWSSDSTAVIWIQTDGDDSNEGEFAGMGQQPVLAGEPVTGRIRTLPDRPERVRSAGLCWSTDRRTMFVGIQHPGAPFPDGEGTLPTLVHCGGKAG